MGFVITPHQQSSVAILGQSLPGSHLLLLACVSAATVQPSFGCSTIFIPLISPFFSCTSQRVRQFPPFNLHDDLTIYFVTDFHRRVSWCFAMAGGY